MILTRLKIALVALFSFLLQASSLASLGGSDGTASVAWKPIGPFGGDVRQVIVDAMDPNIVYVGTGNGNVFRSDNAGSSWSLPAQGLKAPGHSIDALVADSSERHYLYAGVWSIHRDDEGGVFRSQDRGNTWQALEGIKGHSVRALAQSESNPSVLVAGTLDGVYQSGDWGDSWSRISPGGHPEIRNVESVAIHPADPSTIMVGTWHLPWKTSDGGKTWSRAGTRETGVLDDSDIFSILIDAENHDRIFMSACTGLYQSGDSGSHWTKVRGIPSNSKRTRVVFQHPTRLQEIYAGTTEGLWRSDDGGSAWRLVTSRSLVVNDMAVSARSPNVAYVATDEMGLLRSQDGGLTFTPSNQGLAGRPVATAARDLEESARLYAGLLQQRTGGSLWLSEDNGSTWSSSAKGLRAGDVYCLHQPQAVAHLLIAGTSVGLFRSEDQGRSWAPWGLLAGTDQVEKSAQPQRAMRGKPRSNSSARRSRTAPPARRSIAPSPLRDHIMQIIPEPTVPTHLLAVGWDGLYRIDLRTGAAKLLFRPPAGSRSLSISARTVEGSERILLGSSSGLYESVDGGAHWRPINFSAGSHAVQSIGISSGSAGNIYLGTDIGLFRRRSGDTTWERRGGGLPPISVSAILINPDMESEVWVADQRKGGIYFSLDAADNWLRVDSGLSDPRIWSLHFTNEAQSTIFAGSFGGGIYLGLRPPATPRPGTAGNR